MSETNKPTSLFPEVCTCVNSTQAPANFYSADLFEEQPIADRCATIPFDGSEYVAENSAFVSWSGFSDELEDREISSVTSADVASLVALIQEMRCSNTNLLERVVQLEQALNHSQDELQLQKERSHIAESMLTQKLDDLTDAKDRVDCLSDKLKTAHQTVQRQQISIKTLTTQLANSQERIAQMERECSLTQADYNEKFHQLSQTENSCRELRARLIRQQRYTMQLKVALEKCAEAPVRSYQSQDDCDRLYGITYGQTIYSQQASSLFPQAQPITPWAVQSPSFSDVEPTKTGSSFGSQSTHNEEQLTTGDQQPTLFNSPTPSVEQSFFFTRSFDAEQDEANWQNLFNLLETEEDNETDNSADLILDTEGLAALDGQLNDLNWAIKDESKFSCVELPQTSQCQPPDSTQSKTTPNRVSCNSPSPVVYPLHPPKGRKSLSAIELPNFSQKRK
jgi:hypothetical protein